MTRTPAGRLFRTATGHDLVLTRTFRAPAADVWASLTEPERTARVGAGWEYYLDMLVASRDGSPLPRFDDYHPAMGSYYRSLAAEPAS
ncbi:hypothetical protein ABZS77_28065 [Micromonospora sp. NPDC005298]|uniref:hypothetical protein n=1 Tax=Micromonospora sp. NPDC005298 TaxID=3156873 RepID=UPI0033B68913